MFGSIQSLIQELEIFGKSLIIQNVSLSDYPQPTTDNPQSITMQNFIPPARFFPYLTWTEIQAMPDKANVVIIQPVGAIEQHGPHLPLIVDSAIGVAVLGKALEKLNPDIPAYALPPLYYGKSNEHWHFPGTISLSAQTLLAILHEVADSIYQAGFRKWVLMNSHGGQPQVMEIAARDIHLKYEDLMVFPLFTWRVPNITNELLTLKEQQFMRGMRKPV
jgi:creatinine amidohydrolase